MYGSNGVSEDAERTAFRRAEKKYKVYYNESKSSKKKKQLKKVDLSEVIDFKSIQHSFNQCGKVPPEVFAVQCDFDRPVFGIENCPGKSLNHEECKDSVCVQILFQLAMRSDIAVRPSKRRGNKASLHFIGGFYFIPDALTVEEQGHWIRESLISFPQPYNRTNHNAIYGPIRDLFVAAKERKVLVEREDSTGDLDSLSNPSISNMYSERWKFYDENTVSSRESTCKSIPASVLLRKLRWSTLGLQFDWSKRNYNMSLPHNKIPDALCELAKTMAAPAISEGEVFRPEAAIVNYFGLGDMLGGHLDDMEVDWTKPIVSMSLGCKAIFLLGGKSRDDPPFAMFLRSGDVVLMAGKARECFHGVPRIFTDQENAEITPLELMFSNEDDLCFLEYIRSSRININIRQVF